MLSTQPSFLDVDVLGIFGRYWFCELDHSYLVEKLTSSKIADTKVSGF